jgi:hypothetical protein
MHNDRPVGVATLVNGATGVSRRFEWIHNAEGIAVSAAFGGESATIFDVDDLSVRVKLVHIEVEELVKQLRTGLLIP